MKFSDNPYLTFEGKTLEEKIKEDQRISLERRWKSKLAKAKIPKRYWKADLATCKPEVAGWLESDNLNLFLWSETPGNGKTYSGCAILLTQLLHSSCRFASFIDIDKDVRSAFDDESDESEKEVALKYADYDLLMIDDLGKRDFTSWGQSLLFDIVDMRSREMKRTIFTSNLSLTGLELLLSDGVIGSNKTASATVSRIKEDCLGVPFKESDRRQGTSEGKFF